ncbi:heterokaryon incompatibility [Pyrenophora seminiperda CCB06]|uniref:Heterokaryon incompatibility n=1 Tax=Pyrenophora seminiperda CCB06 TaxID=1302712 RepID=A0A3M7MBV7_9PLEO|nr:heterokaryon incompatibility [Pyrenophora seminiperda CCB06]
MLAGGARSSGGACKMAGLAGPPSCAKIQLILLQPAESHDAPILCEQIGFDAIDAVSIPPFVALSYFVRDNAQSPRTAVVVDGQNVDVPNTLAAALRHIRSTEDPLYTWIDPLCTGNLEPGDPEDVIKQNFDIYSKSNRVIIWVDDTTPPIQQQIAMLSVNRIYAVGEPVMRTEALEFFLKLPLTTSTLCHCQPLFSKPWWHWQRVEALLDLDLGPKTLFCYGQYQLTWAHFVSLVHTFQFTLLRVDVDYPVWLDQVLLQIPGNIPEMFKEPFRSQVEGPVSSVDNSVWGCGPLFAHPQDILYWVSSPLEEHNAGRNLSRMSTRLCNRYRRRCRRKHAGTEATTQKGSTSTPDEDGTSKATTQKDSNSTSDEDGTPEAATQGSTSTSDEDGTSDAALQLWLSVLSQRARYIGDEETTNILQSALASMESQGGSDTSTLSERLADINQPYIYRALSPGQQEIRVLLLHPSCNRDAELRCDLFPLDIEYWLGAQAVERLPYMALSYTWGPSDPAQFICLGERQKRITPSLFKALQEFRDPCVPVLLWVDAVCIDQSNITEKNHQVGMMGMVYTHAGCVLAWIDDSEEVQWEYAVDPQIELDRLRLVMDSFSYIEIIQFSALYKVGRCDVRNQPSLAEILKAIPNFNFIHSLNTIFRRNYWTRVWTMQEILLSHNVLVCYGGYTVYFQTILFFFGKICDWIYPLESMDYADRSIDNTQFMSFLHVYSDIVHGKSPSLLQAMLMSRERHATVRHDHIYGILGVADREQSEQFIPDYGSTLFSVSHDIFRRVVLAEENLDILSACEIRNHYSADPIVSDNFVALHVYLSSMSLT